MRPCETSADIVGGPSGLTATHADASGCPLGRGSRLPYGTFVGLQDPNR